MKLFVNILFILFSSTCFSPPTIQGENVQRKKQDFYCSACQMMSETIFREMNNVDPNERIQVGSFRVDGRGQQNLKDVPIVETRFHLENVIDNLCSKFLRSTSDPIAANLKNLYEHACDDILEEHHDNLIDLLLKQNKNIVSHRNLAEIFCLENNQYCQVEEFEEFFKPKPTPIEETEETEETEEEEEKEGEKSDL